MTDTLNKQIKEEVNTPQHNALANNNEGFVTLKLTDSSHPQSVKKNFFAERLTSLNSQVAKKIGELPYFNALAVTLDSEILTYTCLKYYFDVLHATQSSVNPMHDWLLTPEGIVTAAVETVALTSFSLIANTSDKDDPRAYRQAIMALWPYCRNIISALKDASRSVHYPLKIAALFTETNLNHVIMPLGLPVSAVSVLNCVWFQRMHKQRQELKGELQALLNEITTIKIAKDDHLDIKKLREHRASLQKYYGKIRYQSSTQQRYAYLSAAYRGMIEGLVDHIVIITLISFTSPAFIPVAAFCIVFSLAAITARIYEEYEYQRNLEIDCLSIKLRLKEQELEALNVEETLLKGKGEKATDLEGQYALIVAEMHSLNEQINSKKPSTLNSALSDIKNSLAVYTVINRALITSLMFFSTVPTTLLATNIIVGMALLVGFTIYTLIKHCRQQQTQTQDKENGDNNNKRRALENAYEKANRILKELIKASNTLAITPGSRFFRDFLVSDWLNVTHTFFSSLKNGQKLISYILMISYLELSLHNDFQDKPIIMKLAVAVGIFSALILSLRAYALNFGSQPIHDENNIADKIALSETVESVQGGKPPIGKQMTLGNIPLAHVISEVEQPPNDGNDSTALRSNYRRNLFFRDRDRLSFSHQALPGSSNPAPGHS